MQSGPTRPKCIAKRNGRSAFGSVSTLSPRTGTRLALLRDQAGLEHIQTDDKTWDCLPDLSGPDFFFYDLSCRCEPGSAKRVGTP